MAWVLLIVDLDLDQVILTWIENLEMFFPHYPSARVVISQAMLLINNTIETMIIYDSCLRLMYGYKGHI